MHFPSNIILDSKQKDLVSLLSVLSSKLKSSFLNKLFSKLPAGIYIYGSVGCGKSMISKWFFENLACKKLFLHYQDFMKDIHKALHLYDIKQNVIEKLAREYSSKTNVLCIDEFEIKDITDAMIVGRLFYELKKRGVFILLTSNTAPKDLYKDGLQRELFLPFIDFILSEFDIFSFDESVDYRMLQMSSTKRILYPLDLDTKKRMNNIINHLVDRSHYTRTVLKVFGREIEFSRTYKSILVTSFGRLCQNNFSYNDYIEICKHFGTIIMEDVPIMDSSNIDAVIRFINFIDNVYSHNNLLFISLNAEPSKIYQGKARALEFKRTISRLHEIESDNYFKNAKK